MYHKKCGNEVERRTLRTSGVLPYLRGPSLFTWYCPHCGEQVSDMDTTILKPDTKPDEQKRWR